MVVASGIVAPKRLSLLPDAGRRPRASSENTLTRKRRFTVFQKGLVLVGVPTLFQLAFIAFFVQVQNDASTSERWALHTKDVIAQAEGTFRLMVQEFSDTRGLVLLGGATAESEAARRGDPTDVVGEVDRLRALVADNAEQVVRVTSFRNEAAGLMAWISRVNDLIAAGKHDEAGALIRDPSSAERVKRLRGQLDEIVATEQKLDTLRVNRVAEIRRRIRWALGASLVVSLVVAGLLLWAFTHGIATRMKAVAGKAVLLGERKPLGPPVGGSDEITQVDDAFRVAAARLEELHAGEQKAHADAELRAAELARVNQDLSVKTRENETFVYSVSHDLRSPLVNLQGFSRELARSCEDLRKLLATEASEMPEALRTRFNAILDADVRESVHFIQTAVSRSASIIDALLRLSRAGRIEYTWTVVPINVVVDRIVTAMGATIRERGVSVVVVNELPDAFGDATAIEQVLGNLVGNAVNYADPARPGRIEVGVLPGLSEAAPDRPLNPLRTYFVRDNGVGIPKAYLPKMFVAFQRLHGQMAAGEGIGLALVRRMVERHGGRVWVESEEGVGSTFFVSLPQPSASTDENAPVAESASPDTVSERKT